MRILLLFVLVAVGSLLQAEDLTGEQWVTLSHNLKVAYTWGFIQGTRTQYESDSSWSAANSAMTGEKVFKILPLAEENEDVAKLVGSVDDTFLDKNKLKRSVRGVIASLLTGIPQLEDVAQP